MGRDNEKYVRFLDQHGVARLDELGIAPAAAHKRAAAGRIYRIHQSVYGLVPRELLTRDGLYMAAVLACGPGAVLSHRSAAALHGLRQYGAKKVEVTVPRRSARRHDGVRVHRSTTLAATDVTVVNNIPVTTVHRTLLDLADVLPRRPLEKAFDQAEILEVLDLNAINDQLAPSARRPAAKRVKQLLKEHYIGATPTVNEFEDAFLALTRRLNLPDPEVNVWIPMPDGGDPIQADFVWREQRVIVETDGRRTHGTRQAFESDRRRDQRLLAAGWRVIRTTWQQLTRRPAELESLLWQVVGRG